MNVRIAAFEDRENEEVRVWKTGRKLVQASHEAILTRRYSRDQDSKCECRRMIAARRLHGFPKFSVCMARTPLPLASLTP